MALRTTCWMAGVGTAVTGLAPLNAVQSDQFRVAKGPY